VLGGSLTLAPNALAIMQSLGLFDEIEKYGYPVRHMWFKHSDGAIAGKYFFGSASAFGYDALRLERKHLMQVLNSKAQACGISIEPRTFSSATRNASGNGVVTHFADGTTDASDILIGADGIQSAVRSLIPGNKQSDPFYTGFLALNTVIDCSDVPESYLMPCLQLTKAGGIIIGPDDSTGKRIFVATQVTMDDRSREEWNKLLHDTELLHKLITDKIPHCPPVVQDILNKKDKNSKITFWPLHVVPPLDIIGDAAHALPPTIGQGVGQGIEDSFLLAQVLGRLAEAQAPTRLSLSAAMQLWQTLRQSRISKVSRLSTIVGSRLLPPHMQDTLVLSPEEAHDLGKIWETSEADFVPAKQGDGLQEPRDPSALSWLYKADLMSELDKAWAEAFGADLEPTGEV
jgi:2-polyprenyl-6-methoxyphenol hydroxylase-like FAD-dependent oxidoreductase